MAPHRAEDDDESDAPAESGESHEGQRQYSKENPYFLRPGDELCSGTISLNLARDFVRSWTTLEGFRDIFQNWFVISPLRID
jgi:hypothetical protein